MDEKTVYENIDSEEVRIFPFYKGKYLGKDNVGFASMGSVRSYMNDVPKEDVYNECFGGYEDHYFIGRLILAVSRAVTRIS